MSAIQDLGANGPKGVARRAASWAGILVLAAALGGCFTSRQPLFAEATAVAAFGDGGRYLAYQRIGHRYRRDEAVQLRRHDNSYDYVSEKGDVTPVTLHPLAKDLFVIQAKSDDGSYLYARLRLRGATGFVEAADCDKQDMKTLAALGIAAQESELAKALTGRAHARTHDCVLDGVHDAGKAFAAIRFGPPTGKLVKE
jgi:hypothetical protein